MRVGVVVALAAWCALPAPTLGHAQAASPVQVTSAFLTDSAPGEGRELAKWAAAHQTHTIACLGARSSPRCTVHLVLVLAAPLADAAPELEIAAYLQGQAHESAATLLGRVTKARRGATVLRFSGAIPYQPPPLSDYMIVVRRSSGEILARLPAETAWSPPAGHGCRGWTQAASTACAARRGSCKLMAPPICGGGPHLTAGMIKELQSQSAEQRCACVCEGAAPPCPPRP